jgi:hypothetical protein
MLQQDSGELHSTARNPLIFRYSFGRLIVNFIEGSAILDEVHYTIHANPHSVERSFQASADRLEFSVASVQAPQAVKIPDCRVRTDHYVLLSPVFPIFSYRPVDACGGSQWISVEPAA